MLDWRSAVTNQRNSTATIPNRVSNFQTGRISLNMFSSRNTNQQIGSRIQKHKKLIDSKAFFREKNFLGFKLADIVPKLDLSSSFLGSEKLSLLLRTICELAKQKGVDLKNTTIFTDINLARCDI